VQLIQEEKRGNEEAENEVDFGFEEFY